MKYRWSVAPPQPILTGILAKELNISPLLAQCLLNRGWSEPERIQRFLQPRLRDLSDPFLLPDMAPAVDRLLQARERNESLVVFGDYDVDGITATALLVEVLGHLGWRLDCYLPHRLEEGYGLSRAGVENCLRKFPATLLLAVDCGSSAVETANWLRERGVDVIVLDHHQIVQPAPGVTALVNPQRQSGTPRRSVPSTEGKEGSASAAQGDSSEVRDRPEVCPFTELCSVGLAFKLAHAIVKRGRALGWPAAAEYDLRPLLDLVALGTIADLVPLTGENRILVRSGLAWLNHTRRPGLLALSEVAGVSRPMAGHEVGFQLAPRLNAAGRLENAQEALQLLLARDWSVAEPLARRLDTRNRDRQEIERGIATEVIGAVRSRFDPGQDYVIVEGRPGWHIGVVGIVAARVLQEFYRPTIILGGDGEEWRGSGRSIEGFDLAAALRECDDLLLKHGGHVMAAGLTIRPPNLEALRARLNSLARRALPWERLQPTLRLDAEVATSELTAERVTELGLLQQTGIGNPPVQLAIRNVAHHRPLLRMGAGRKHAKLWVTDGQATREAVLWGAGDAALPVGRFDLAFTPQLHQFQGRTTLQLKVLDWRPAAS